MARSTAGRGAGRGKGKAAPRQAWHGVPVTAIYRHLGAVGATGAEAMRVAKAIGLKPNLNTAYSQVGAGANNTRGGRPKLDADVAARLKARLADVRKA